MSTFDIGLLNTSYQITDTLNFIYPSDIYNFTLNNTQSLQLSITNISIPVEWQLKNQEGTTLQSGSINPTNSEAINLNNLIAGGYYLEFIQTNGDTNYSLNVSPFSQMEVESGFFTVGQTGQVGVDYLIDGGGYQGELAIFSLTGMAAFTPGSEVFIKEVARRSLSNSTLGYTVIKDTTEGAKFSPSFPWEGNLNKGEYQNIKLFDLTPGDKFAFMLVPNGTVQEVFNNPLINGAKRPLFSLATANPNDAFQVGQIADVTGDGKTFVMEDLRLDKSSDKDYNDVIFRVTGAQGKAVKLDEVINPLKDWRKMEFVKDLIAYINTPPQFLQLTTKSIYQTDETVNLSDAKVYDENGDLSQVNLWLKKNDEDWSELDSVTSFTFNDDWATFNYALPNLTEGNYELKAIAFDQKNQSSNEVVTTFQVNTANVAPSNLQFNIPQTSYFFGDTINITGGKVYEVNGISDLKKVSFELQKEGGSWQPISDVVNFTPDSAENWGLFDYTLSGLEIGNYQLKAVAYDRSYAPSNQIISNFSIVHEPVITPPPPPNSAPQFLQFSLQSTYQIGEQINLTNGKIFDENGTIDLNQIQFILQKEGEEEVTYFVNSFVSDNLDNRWGSFSHSWNDLAPGNYRLEAIATDKANTQSNKVVYTFTVETPEIPPPQPNRAPAALDFSILPLYANGETLSFSGGKVDDPDGASDVDAVYFWLGTINGEQVGTSFVSEFTPDNKGVARFDFSYDLSNLAPGKYQLWAIATDKSGDYSEPTIQTFSVTTDAGIKGLSDEERLAMVDAAKLDNYTPEELAATRQWVVWITPGLSSPELANLVQAVDKGATGYIPNTYIWEFPEIISSDEAIQRLNSLPGLELSYPLVPIHTSLTSTPNEEPLVRKPGTLNPTYPVSDPNDINLRNFLNNYQWHLRTGVNPSADANITSAWSLAQGRGVVIGIVDDGLDFNNPDLKDRYRADLSWDFNENNSNPSPTYNKTIALANTPRFIRDYATTNLYLDSPLTGVLSDVNVRLNLNHARLSDLEILLDSPNDPIFNPTIGRASSAFRRIKGGNGSEKNPVKLFGNFIGAGANLTNTTFDDQATFSLSQGFAPFTGKFRPLGSLADLNEQWAGGLWNLRITDKVWTNPGLLSSLALDLQTYNPHGTAVAGIAAASGNNGLNGSGVAPLASLAALRLVADAVTDQQIAKALSHKNQNIDIYNNSWKLEDWLIKPALALTAMKEGTSFGRNGLGNNYVFGAGNDEWNGGNINYNGMANSRYVIPVAAIDHTGELTLYSEVGAPLLVSAYSSSSGVGITTTDLVGNNGYSTGDYTNSFGGTSAAAPLVSGVIALMLEANPNLNWRDVQHILVRTAKQNDPSDLDWIVNGAGHHVNHKYGFGAIDAEAAVRLAKSWTSVGDEVTISSELQNVLTDIPDGDEETGVTSAISINDDISVEKVEVVFNADHNDWCDLKIVLISPDGTQSVLADSISSDPNVASADKLKPASNIWTFTSARHWGESSKGEWRLQVFDREGNQVQGDWNSWKLNIYGAKPIVTISVMDASATEGGDPGQFIVSRTGSSKYDLTVNYTVTGTAINGTDYNTISGNVTIPAGTNYAPIIINTKDDEVYEGFETVIVDLAADDTYNLDATISAKVLISDNETPITPFTKLSNVLRGQVWASSLWGDYDNDKDLDAFLTGSFSPFQDYRNDSNNFFTATPILSDLPLVTAAALGDYDNDNDLDIFTGSIYFNESKVRQNNNNDFTSTTDISLASLANGSAAWGDYNNDGNLDLLITGHDGRGNGYSKVYRNNANGSFTEIAASLAGVSNSSAAWGDYDNDSDLDIILAGWNGSSWITKIYRNDGGFGVSGWNFTDINFASWPETYNSAAWGDYDNDGDLDVLLTGPNVSTGSTVYRNDGNDRFTDIRLSLPMLWDSSAAWGDYDNDGDLDILLTGWDLASRTTMSKIYSNNGDSSFTAISAPITGISKGSAAWGDYDNDGDLDILLNGQLVPGDISGIAEIYQNNSQISNTAPTAPTGLNTLVSGTSVTLSWNPASDTQTPHKGLTYNLRVGTQPGASNIMSPMAASNGERKVAQIGNVNLNTSWTLKNLKPGTYYWSVQAIDNAFAGSEFATEGTFTVV